MKKLMVTAVAVAAFAGVIFGAEEAKESGARGASALSTKEAEVEVEDGYWNDWRITVGGFGRGNMRAKMLGLGSERVTAYGVDLDVQYNVWQNRNFNIWAGIGGTFCPRQKMSDSYGKSTSSSSHDVSDDGSTIIDFNYDSHENASVDLGYGECRLLLVPEWKIMDSFALGARIGVAFDWINVKCSRDTSWQWNQTTVIDVPPYVHEQLDLNDSGMSSESDTYTKFAAQAILGLQATYMFTDWVGIYANFDWRLGGETTFDCGDAGEVCLDMSGWYWGAGVVVSF